jgi:GPH family glycoside/pentoside/hexuronide:cation symporter
MGQLFHLAGYITPQPDQPLPTQPDQAVLFIRLFASIVPALLLILSLIFAYRYSISREQHKANLAQLGSIPG